MSLQPVGGAVPRRWNLFSACPSVFCLRASQPEQLRTDAPDGSRDITGYPSFEYHKTAILTLRHQSLRDPYNAFTAGPDEYIGGRRRYHVGRHSKAQRHKVVRFNYRVCVWHSSCSGIRQVAASFIGVRGDFQVRTLPYREEGLAANLGRLPGFVPELSAMKTSRTSEPRDNLYTGNAHSGKSGRALALAFHRLGSWAMSRHSNCKTRRWQ